MRRNIGNGSSLRIMRGEPVTAMERKPLWSYESNGIKFMLKLHGEYSNEKTV